MQHRYRILFLGVVLFFCCSHSLLGQNEGLNKYIKFEAKNLSFAQAIEGFEQRMGLGIHYDADLVTIQKKYNLQYNHIRAKAALSDFLSQNGLTYTLAGTNIILKRAWIAEKKTYYTLSGRVSNSQSGEFLGNADITINGQLEPVYTSEAGFFTLFLKNDTNFLKIHYPGFELKYDTILGDRDYFVNYQLDLIQTWLPEAEVKAATTYSSVINGNTDQYRLTKDRIHRLPNLLGEPDIIRVMSLYPGVVGGSEGMLGMYIRGGASDQNLVLLDDVPVFNSYHLYGIFSIFNDDAIKSANLMKGSFPVRYGGRLSSVVNVQSKEGNLFRLKSTVSIGILASKIFLEGPLISNRTTFTFAYRRSYLDFLAKPVSRLFLHNDSLQNNVYYFWDLNSRVTHRFSNRSRLTASFYTGRDIAGVDEKSSYKSVDASINERRRQLASWGNLVGSLKWNYYMGSKTGLTVKVHYTGYNYGYDQNYSIEKKYTQQQKPNLQDYTEYKLKNGIADYEASFLLNHTFSNHFAMNGGGGYVQHKFIPGDRSLSSTISGNEAKLFFNDPRVTTPKIYAFAEGNGMVGKKLFYQIGLRVSSYKITEQYYYILPEPRFSARYRLTPKSWIKIGAMRTRQFFHLLTNLTLGLPSDLWVPSTINFQPSQSDQASVGYSYGKSMWQFTTEVFYKKLNHLLEYKSDAGYITSAVNWENAVTSGSGEAYGWEMMMEKNKGRLTGWFSYALMWNWRQFAELNQGAVFPARYDRRHNLYIAGVYRVNKSIDFSFSWTYNSGFAITTPIGKYLSPAPGDPYREIYVYGDRNNARTRDNHRLDIAFNFEKQVLGKHKMPMYSRTWSVGLFNTYNRRNPFYINLGIDSKGNRVLSQVSLLPILPNVSYKIAF